MLLKSNIARTKLSLHTHTSKKLVYKQQQPIDYRGYLTHVMWFGILASEDLRRLTCVCVWAVVKVIVVVGERKFLSQLTLLFFGSPTNCGRQMTKDNTQTPATNNLARFVDIILGYVTGLVTATYRSNDMAHKLRIDAVHIHTSSDSHIEHHKSPNIHT